MPRKSKRRFRKRRNMKGGTNKTAFAKPEVNQTTSSGAIQGAMYDQKENNTDLTKINKEMAGGGAANAAMAQSNAAGPPPRGSASGEVVVPQMNQAGTEGNDEMAGTIETTLGGTEEASYDKQVTRGPAKSTYKGGRSGRKRRRTRKKRRRKRRKSRRKSRRKKRRTRRRRRRRK